MTQSVCSHWSRYMSLSALSLKSTLLLQGCINFADIASCAWVTQILSWTLIIKLTYIYWGRGVRTHVYLLLKILFNGLYEGIYELRLWSWWSKIFSPLQTKALIAGEKIFWIMRKSASHRVPRWSVFTIIYIWIFSFPLGRLH